ncbi:class I adenylate-forming enzyme family protein [Rhodococcus sp. D-1]|uniref:class I adenylate-forming enzyme family protein n=1 Tax=Rhodococcus sp. D-1 TaxID=1912238 RepID=UPI0009755C10|nr:AMP-binding protein [Rhodococcus sp. D-1]OMQ23111.1 hypothetical protein BK799_31985 [Rhodococcus sp. D-1]
MKLTDMIDEACYRWSDRIAFRVPGNDDAWTYEQVRTTSDAIAAALQHEGAERAVAILAYNSPLAFIAQLGVIKAGLAYVPLNTKSAASDWSSLVAAAGATALLVGDDLAERAQPVVAQNSRIRIVRTIGGPTTTENSVEKWAEHYRGTSCRRVPDDREASCWIIGSGGTTGAPKAVAIPHRAINAGTLALLAHMPDERPIQVVSAPLTHAAGCLTYPVLLQGGESIVLDGARPATILRTIDKYRATRIFLPPTAIYALLASPEIRNHDYSSLRYFLYGAAPMSVAKLEEAMEVFGPVMAQFYGQAESPTICTWFGPGEHQRARADESLRHRLRSCGQPSGVVSLRIVDKEGKALPAHTTGEIAVKSDLRMLGYLNAAEESAELVTVDGYQRTGDVGHIDEDGFVYISDRSRDMIITGGFNVFPSEVEAVIWRHPAVEDCAVFGVPDDYWGEAVVAAVELKDGAAEATDEILGMVRAELGPVKTPKRITYTNLPRSAVGKVLKRALRDEVVAAAISS